MHAVERSWGSPFITCSTRLFYSSSFIENMHQPRRNPVTPPKIKPDVVAANIAFNDSNLGFLNCLNEHFLKKQTPKPKDGSKNVRAYEAWRNYLFLFPLIAKNHKQNSFFNTIKTWNRFFLKIMTATRRKNYLFAVAHVWINLHMITNLGLARRSCGDTEWLLDSRCNKHKWFIESDTPFSIICYNVFVCTGICHEF